MKIAHPMFETLPHSRVRLSLDIPKDEVRAYHERILQRYRRNTELKGFRKGKVPTEMLLSRFEEKIKRDMTVEILAAAMQEALKNQKYRTLHYDPPQLTRVSEYNLDKKLSMQVEFDVWPEIAPPAYDNIKITIPETKVGAGDVQRELKRLQKERAVYNPKDARAKIEGTDTITVDLWEVTGDQRKNIRTDFRILMDSQNAPMFASELLGCTVGQEKTIPDPHDPSARMVVSIKDIRAQTLPKLDHAFANAVNKKFKTLGELKKTIGAELATHYKKRIEQIKQERVMSHLASLVTVDIPRSMIEHTNMRRWDALRAQHNMSEEEIVRAFAEESKTKDDIFRHWEPDTIAHITNLVVIDTLIREENITVDDTAVDAYITDKAVRSGHAPETLKKLYIKNKKMADVIYECEEMLLFKRVFTKAEFVVDKRLQMY